MRLAEFNQRMEEQAQRVVRDNVGTPEFRAEYVKSTNLYKRVAKYDVDLAGELFVSTVIFCYTFGIGFLKEHS